MREMMVMTVYAKRKIMVTMIDSNNLKRAMNLMAGKMKLQKKMALIMTKMGRRREKNSIGRIAMQQ